MNILGNELYKANGALLETLLIDRSRPCEGDTPSHIVWGTDSYAHLGPQYGENEPILAELITGDKSNVIVPRALKSKREQQFRSRDKAEVFTPSWVCNHQNNLIDEEWFGVEGVFNKELDKGWITSSDPVPFPAKNGKNWQDYVTDIRLEITCGEAPYLVSRYDAISGEIVPVRDRIGLLGRKLRVVSENTSSVEDWYCWTVRAYKSIYGYEWQGDNLLLARQNALYTFFDYYQEYFSCLPSLGQAMEIAYIISWNLWQMDGIKGVIPNSCELVNNGTDLFGEPVSNYCRGCSLPDEKDSIHNHIGIYCKIMDWEKNEAVRFVELIK